MPSTQKRNRKTVILTFQGLQRLEMAKKASIQKSNSRFYTLEDLSEVTGLSSHTLSKIHAGKTGVDLRTLARYFSAFGLKLTREDYHQPSRNGMGELMISLHTAQADEVLQNHAIVSWGMAPDVSRFYGRSSELSTLRRWILDDRCRLIMLLGMGGIGKTYLATKLAEQVQSEFKVVIWRSLRPISRSHSPLPFSYFLDDLIGCLAPSTMALESIAAKIWQLLDLLNCIPSLLVLDNIESVLSNTTSIEPIAHSDQEAYINLLKCLGQGRHQSCVILTSRSEPPQFVAENIPYIRSLFVGGLPVEDVRQMFETVVHGDASDWDYLVNYYGGNPLILSIVSRTCQCLFNGDIAEFLNHNTLIFDDIHELLQQQLSELSESERIVLKTLANQRIPLAFSELKSRIPSTISTKVLLESLKALKVRSLIDKTCDLSLQPLLRDFVHHRQGYE